LCVRPEAGWPPVQRCRILLCWELLYLGRLLRWELLWRPVLRIRVLPDRGYMLRADDGLHSDGNVLPLKQSGSAYLRPAGAALTILKYPCSAWGSSW
jgi:hypothetical protein